MLQRMERQLSFEVVGDEKVKIAIEEDEEPWDIIEDEMTPAEEVAIDEQVNEEYL